MNPTVIDRRYIILGIGARFSEGVDGVDAVDWVDGVDGVDG